MMRRKRYLFELFRSRKFRIEINNSLVEDVEGVSVNPEIMSRSELRNARIFSFCGIFVLQ